MDDRRIGIFINELRQEKGISRAALCEGLCGTSTLNRLELEERVPDVWLIDCMLQRLGKSADMFEVILSDEEYEGIQARDTIEEALDAGEYARVHQLLKNYQQMYIEPYTLQQQYIYHIHALLEKQKDNHTDCIRYIKQAIESTLPEFNPDKKRETLLCVKEIELLIMLADEYYIVNDMENGNAISTYLIRYIEENYEDKSEFVKVYPKIVYLYAKSNPSKQYQAFHIEKCERALECMREEGTLVFLIEIMELLLHMYRDLKLEKKAKQLHCWVQALQSVCKEMNFEIYASKYITGWFKESRRRDYYLYSELVTGQRSALKICREELAYGIYEFPESLARVEAGKQMPNSVTSKLLAEKLRINLGRYSGYLATDDYNVLEQRKKINQLLSRKEYENAKIELEKLRLMLNLESVVNKQYFERTEAQLNYKLGLSDASQLERELRQALERTYIISGKGIWRIPFKQEVEIINLLAIALWEQNKIEESIALFEKLEQCHAEGKINKQHQLRRRELIYRNLTKAYEDTDRLREAEDTCNSGLLVNLFSWKGDAIDFYMSEKMCLAKKTIADTEEKKKAMKRYLEHAFFLSDLFRNVEYNRAYAYYYKKNIDESVDWY